MDIGDCPNLKRYYEHFSATNGEAEIPGRLPRLIIWIRLSTEDAENEELVSVPKFFEMDYETEIEFYSWGHNSRWMNVFWRYAINNKELIKEKCLEIASLNKSDGLVFDPDVF